MWIHGVCDVVGTCFAQKRLFLTQSTLVSRFDMCTENTTMENPDQLVPTFVYY
jgi:hypothetical protein